MPSSPCCQAKNERQHFSIMTDPAHQVGQLASVEYRFKHLNLPDRGVAAHSLEPAFHVADTIGRLDPDVEIDHRQLVGP